MIGHWKTAGPVLYLLLSVLEMLLLRASESLALLLFIWQKFLRWCKAVYRHWKSSPHHLSFLFAFIKGNIKMFLETRGKSDEKPYYFLLQRAMGTHSHKWKEANLKRFLKSKEGDNSCMWGKGSGRNHILFGKHWYMDKPWLKKTFLFRRGIHKGDSQRWMRRKREWKRAR